MENTKVGGNERKPDEEYIGLFMSTGKYPEGTKFARSPRKTPTGGSPYWYVTCPVCSKDKYTQAGLCTGTFEAQAGSLKQGQRPCRCGSNRWTEDQVVYRLNNEAGDVSFVRWVGEYVSLKKTRTIMMCNVHKDEFEVAPIQLLSKKTRCPKCSKEHLANYNGRNEEALLARMWNTGSFKEGMKITRSTDLDKAGNQTYWNVFCPKCTDDTYTKAGLCTGTFRATTGGLTSGMLPCRCARSPKLTPAQWEHRVVKELARRDTGLSLVEIIGKGSSAKLLLHCEKHGNFSIGMLIFIYEGCGCAECAVNGFSKTKPASLYVLKVEGLHKSFTGYGISNDVETRLGAHKANLDEYGLRIVDKHIVPMSGYSAAEIERQIAIEFPHSKQEVTGFRREATFAKHYREVIEFVDQALISNSANLESQYQRTAPALQLH